MEENEFFTFGDNNPEVAQNTVNEMAKPEEGRSFGEGVEDVLGATLNAIANGRRPLAVIAAGLNAGLNTKTFQAQKQALINDTRRAELDLRAKELSVLGAQQALNQRSDMFGLEKAQAEANLEKTRLHNQSEKDMAGIRVENENIRLSNNRIAFQMNQHRIWDSQTEQTVNMLRNNLKKQFGYGSLNIYGQGIIDNSSALDTMVEAMAVMKAYGRSDEEGDYLIGKMGWKRVEKNGKEILVSPDGGTEFEASQKGIKELIDRVQGELRNDIAASYIQGGPVMTLEMAATRDIMNVLGENGAKQFGGEGSVVGLYNRFVNGQTVGRDGKAVATFTPEQKIVHVLARTLKSALEDNKLTDEEVKYLMPSMKAYVTKLGGEIKFGQGIEDTFIKMRDGRTVDLRSFANDMERLDVITPLFFSHLQDIKQKMGANKVQEAYREAQIRNMNASAQGKEQKNAQNAGNGVNGGNGGNDGNGNNEIKQATRDDAVALYPSKISENFSDNQLNKIMGAIDAVNEAIAKDGKLKERLKNDKATLQDLRKLDALWKVKVDFDAAYSPYQNKIFYKELESLYKEVVNYAKAGDIKNMKKAEKAIMMREKALNNRHIKTPEVPSGYHESIRVAKYKDFERKRTPVKSTRNTPDDWTLRLRNNKDKNPYILNDESAVYGGGLLIGRD